MSSDQIFIGVNSFIVKFAYNINRLVKLPEIVVDLYWFQQKKLKNDQVKILLIEVGVHLQERDYVSLLDWNKWWLSVTQRDMLHFKNICMCNQIIR